MVDKEFRPLTGILSAAIAAAISGVILAAVVSILDPSKKPGMSRARRRFLEKKLGRPLPALNSYEEAIAHEVVDSDSISVEFDSIGGLEDVKEELYDLVVLPLRRPELFSGRLLSPQKGILLFGPPGTGKTLLAKALAKESEAVFINLRMSNLMSKWFGDGQKLVSAAFTLANKLQPAILFVDEVDSFLGARGRSMESEALASMKTEFMVQWDGFATQASSRVLVLCATNRPWDLDEAVLRRTSRSFEIPLPDEPGRASILAKILRNEHVDPSLDTAAIAKRCPGLSGADLAELARQAALIPVKEFLQREKASRQAAADTAPLADKRGLRQDDFLRVLSSFKPAKSAATEYQASLPQPTSPRPQSSQAVSADLAALLAFFQAQGAATRA